MGSSSLSLRARVLAGAGAGAGAAALAGAAAAACCWAIICGFMARGEAAPLPPLDALDALAGDAAAGLAALGCEPTTTKQVRMQPCNEQNTKSRLTAAAGVEAFAGVAPDDDAAALAGEEAAAGADAPPPAAPVGTGGAPSARSKQRQHGDER